MNATKINILTTALELFNNLSYAQVTIRMIAQKANMSSGNLNYHYKKREDILEALYFEMVAVFDERIKQLGQKEVSLKSIKEDIRSSMKQMIDYRFFWTDFYNLLMQNENIKKHFNKAYLDRKNGTQLLLDILIEKQLLLKENYPKEHELLIEKMINFGNTWLYASSLYQKNNLTEQYINRQANILLSFLYPYFTTKGKEQCKLLIPDFFE